jgi:molecular chaperone GrpE
LLIKHIKTSLPACLCHFYKIIHKNAKLADYLLVANIAYYLLKFITMSRKKEKIETQETKNQEFEKEVNLENEKENKVEESNKEQVSVEEQANEKSQPDNVEQKYNELNDKYIRLSAEFDNFRRRNLKEKMELIKSAGEDILINILPVMDNFERALKAMEENTAMETIAIKDGIILIYNNFRDFLSQRGIKEIDATGKDFDTDHHEAISKIPVPQEELKGKVIAVVEKGYLMHEKIIRFAKVVVGE